VQVVHRSESGSVVDVSEVQPWKLLLGFLLSYQMQLFYQSFVFCGREINSANVPDVLSWNGQVVFFCFRRSISENCHVFVFENYFSAADFWIFVCDIAKDAVCVLISH